MKTFFSHGKLLLTSEYLVMDGALALAIPTKFGQALTINEIDQLKIIWKSIDHLDTIWFEGNFSLKGHFVKNTGLKNETSERLVQILNSAKRLNPSFLEHHGFEVETKLDFPRNWGLGTSSTLVNNIANWANVDAHALLASTFGGSGYDIACAQYSSPLTYKLTDNGRVVTPVVFDPPFKHHLYFVYLNKKQNSRDSIASYKECVVTLDDMEAGSRLTQKLLSCKDFDLFCSLMEEHENLISGILKISPIKERMFSDFVGSVKSLGGWGGDFVLVTSSTDPRPYFEAKGLTTVIPFSDMILH